MDGISTRTWSIIGCIGLLVFFSYWVRFSAKHPGWNPMSMGFTYQMARSESFDPGFDLSDRDVERLYRGKKAQVVADAKKAADQKLDPKLAAQKNAEMKKRQQDQAKAKAAANAAAQKAMTKAGKMGVNVVDTSMDSGLSGFDESAAPAAAAAYAGPAPASVAKNQAAPAAGEDLKKEEEPTLTATQWRSLLQSAPSSENISKFVTAKRSGHLDSASFYQIVHELLSDSAEDRRNGALQALDQDVSAETYAFMVTENSSGGDADMQGKLKTRIDGYATAANLGILNQVISTSQSPAVLQAAAAGLSAAWAKFKSEHSEQSQEAGGGTGSSGFTLQQFTSFLSTLQSQASNSSSPISDQAGQLATEIQNLSQTTS